MKIHNLVPGIFLLLIVPGTIHAASFDCLKASSAAEKIICSNDELSKLDESLNEAYLQALKRADMKEQTIKSQKLWLKNERNVCRNVECVKKTYERRINELSILPPKVSKSHVPAESIQTRNDKQQESTSGSIVDTAVVNKVETRLKKGPKQNISLVEHGNIVFELDFENFQKQRVFSDEPFAFSSAEAQELWMFFVSKESHLKREPKDGTFAKLGPDSYLIQHYAFFYAQPKRSILTELTDPLPLGNYDIGKIRRLATNKFWSLLSGGDYNHDVGSQFYCALVFEKEPDGSFVARSEHIADFAFRGYEDAQRDGLCGDNTDPDRATLYPTLKSAAHVDKVMVEDVNHDGNDDVIFYTTEQNCKTKKIRQRRRAFQNMGNSFIEEISKDDLNKKRAASFDCGKAASKVEKTVCSNDQLSKLDASLNKAYSQALEQSVFKMQTIRNQKQWLRHERNECQNAECIKRAYEARLKELQFISSYVTIYSDGNVNLTRFQPLGESFKAILAMYALQVGSNCKGGIDNLECELTSSLGLGPQCSKEQISLVRKWFREEIPRMERYPEWAYKHIQQPGQLESICYHFPEGARVCRSWETIRVGTGKDLVFVDAVYWWTETADGPSGHTGYSTVFKILKDRVITVSHKKVLEKRDEND
jgi:uncharacterized protein